jgi:hypothetical protein
MLGKLSESPAQASETDGAAPSIWDASQHAKLKAHIAAREPFLDFILSRTHHDGSVQTFQVSGEPVFNSWNKFMGYHGLGLEIASRH